MNLAFRAASSAKGRNKGTPATAVAEITLPFSSTKTCTKTAPVTFAWTTGNLGFGKNVALSFRIPPLGIFEFSLSQVFGGKS